MDWLARPDVWCPVVSGSGRDAGIPKYSDMGLTERFAEACPARLGELFGVATGVEVDARLDELRVARLDSLMRADLLLPA
jgi:hypothetical protein